MSELVEFIPGLLSSVREQRRHAEEYRRREEKRRTGAAGQQAAIARGKVNRQKVIDVLTSTGEPTGPIPAIATKAGLGYNATQEHLMALIADGIVGREPGRRGLFFVVDQTQSAEAKP